MFFIGLLFVTTLHISVDSVIAFNSCQLEASCDQRSVQCSDTTRLCLCLSTGRLPAARTSGLCLHVSSVNKRCLLYQPCLNGHCLLTNGLELNSNHKKGDPVWQSLFESPLSSDQKLLAFCRCDKSIPHSICNYKVIGRQCTHHSHCSVVPHSQCIAGLCACNQSHYHFDDNCLQRKNFDELCIESTECQPNLYCRSSQCRCRKNFDFNADSGVCVSKSADESEESSSTNSVSNIWDGIAKVGGFIIIIVLMLFLCTKKESELQNESLHGSHRRRSTSTRHRQRSCSINSHRPLTQTSSNASRSSAYRTFEEPVPIKQTIIVPSPAQLIRSLSSSSDEIDYNPYQFDTLFPQQSDNDDPPSYEEVVKESDTLY